VKLIALSGYARSGKDTLADMLVEYHGYTKVAFATPLRNFLEAQDPIVVSNEGCDWQPLSEALEETGGWQDYKSSNYSESIRTLIQRTGTEAGRGMIGDNVWVDVAFKALDPEGKYVFSDARFPNEADAVRNRGGAVVRINRRGVGPAVDNNGVAHSSETSLDDYRFDHVVNNDGDLTLLRNHCDILVYRIHMRERQNA